jgi:DHA2 family multidrug resistance protein
MAGIKKEDMGNATGIYNLLRNLGGSFGVAFVTTMLQRRAQFHQFRLVENLTIFDHNFQYAEEQFSFLFDLKGFGPLSEKAGLGLIYRELLRQASMLGFNDAFHLLSILMLCVFVLIFLLKRPPKLFKDSSRFVQG